MTKTKSELETVFDNAVRTRFAEEIEVLMKAMTTLCENQVLLLNELRKINQHIKPEKTNDR